MHPLISVIIPARDRASFLRQALLSILSQDISVEIIIVDDGSATPLSAELKTSGLHTKIIRHKKSKGSMAARNSGFRHAKGDFIAFLDSDDIWEKDFLKTSLRYLQKNHATVATVCLSNKIYPQEWPLRRILRLKIINVFKDLLKILSYLFNQKNLPRSAPFLGQLSHMVFRKSAIKGLRFNPAYKFCGDWKFILDCLAKGNIRIIPERLVAFRYNSESYTATENKKNPLKKFKYYRMLSKEIIKKYGRTFFVRLFDFHIKHFLPNK